MGVQTSLSCPRGQARTWTATFLTPTNIAGWNFTFTVRDQFGNILIQVTSQSGNIITVDPINGILNIAVTAAQTLWPKSPVSQSNQPPIAYWDLQRSDTGNEDQVGYGQFTFISSYRQ